jgi:hypothetical protein
MKREKRIYENGYWPKIEYWTRLLEVSYKQMDITGALLCSTKISYFSGKQKELQDSL